MVAARFQKGTRIYPSFNNSIFDRTAHLKGLNWEFNERGLEMRSDLK
ncbi:hypothetical protein [Caudoviricetes sp.]|nr:hypothetical protein [Caudoviricetes sp.]UOF81018.1 hypothetical protein [Caudoviricetes sp.]UOF81414.1 hypothetical protein [Caudoviricetes sp.]